MYNYDVFSSFFSDSVLQNVNDPREWYLSEVLRMNANTTLEDPSDSLILRQPGYPAWMCDPIPPTQNERFDIEQLWIRNIHPNQEWYQSLDLYCSTDISLEQYEFYFPDNDMQFRQFSRDFGRTVETEAARNGLSVSLAVFHPKEWEIETNQYIVPHFHFLCAAYYQ